MAEQPQYDVQLAASIGTTLSDQIGTTFGIRQVTSTIMPGGGRPIRHQRAPGADPRRRLVPGHISTL